MSDSTAHPTPSVLLVEDDRELLYYSAGEFRRAGFTVWTAETGEEAVRLFCEHPCDAVLVDDRLPKMQGREVVAAIRALVPKALLLIASGAARPADIDADGWIKKPYSIRGVAERLRKLILARTPIAVSD